MALLEELKALGPALLDAWYVVDEDDRIVDFNPAFHAMFPRAVARKLKTLSCREAAKLPACATEQCLRSVCQSQGPIRLDEVDAEVADEQVRLIISATPVELPKGGKGAL